MSSATPVLFIGFPPYIYSVLLFLIMRDSASSLSSFRPVRQRLPPNKGVCAYYYAENRGVSALDVQAKQ